MDDTDRQQPRFQSRLGMAGALAGALIGYLWGAEWPDVAVGAGVGFIVGGAGSLFGGVWRYLLVFFALAAGFVWLLLHFVVQ